MPITITITCSHDIEEDIIEDTLVFIEELEATYGGTLALRVNGLDVEIDE